jgi:hypothetical protein
MLDNDVVDQFLVNLAQIRNRVEHRLRVSDVHHHADVAECDIGIHEHDALLSLLLQRNREVRGDYGPARSALDTRHADDRRLAGQPCRVCRGVAV